MSGRDLSRPPFGRNKLRRYKNTPLSAPWYKITDASEATFILEQKAYRQAWWSSRYFFADEAWQFFLNSSWISRFALR